MRAAPFFARRENQMTGAARRLISAMPPYSVWHFA